MTETTHIEQAKAFVASWYSISQHGSYIPKNPSEARAHHFNKLSFATGVAAMQIVAKVPLFSEEQYAQMQREHDLTTY